MKTLPNFNDIDYLVREYQRTSQGHFFDVSTMRFFKSRLTSHFRKVDDKTYLFVTTEKACFSDNSRVATLRIARIKRDRKMFCGYKITIETCDDAARTTLGRAKTTLKNWGTK